MDLQSFKENIAVKVYHIDSNKKVPFHRHPKHDEVFYCVKGSGFGVLEGSKVELTVGEAFVVPDGTLHSMGSDSDIYVSSLLIPVVE